MPTYVTSSNSVLGMLASVIKHIKETKIKELRERNNAVIIRRWYDFVLENPKLSTHKLLEFKEFSKMVK